jgi:DNA-binding transcriptional MerR regulator
MRERPYDLNAASKSTSQRLTVGQVARQAGLTPRAVRFYKAEGILASAPRSPNGYRLYTTDDVECLQFIGRLRTFGLGLVDIRELGISRRRQAG